MDTGLRKLCGQRTGFDNIPGGGSSLDGELLYQDSWSQRSKFEGEKWNFKGS